jgi:CheY-like chemotaxis protein
MEANPCPNVRGRILVVDDDADTLDTLVEVLAAEGLSVVGARSGAEAVAAARTAPPALVLLDYRIGDLHGDEVAAMLRAACGQPLPIVLFSGHGSLEVAARKAGAVVALAKPCSLEALFGCLRRALDERPAA